MDRMVKFLFVDSTSSASVSEATTVTPIRTSSEGPVRTISETPVRTSSESPVSTSTNTEVSTFTSTSSEGNLKMTQSTVNYTYLSFRTIYCYKSK